MNWIPGACLLGGIAVTLAGFAFHSYACRYITRHVDAALAPSNVTRLDSRRKAGENVTVLRSVKP